MSDPTARACACALAGLPAMGPGRLRALVRRYGPAGAWARVRPGQGPPDLDEGVPPITEGMWRGWVHRAATTDPAAVLAAHVAAGVAVHLEGEPSYPEVLAGDLAPPAVVFALGRPEVLDRPRVAIVGTRRCTGAGAGLARELGRDLAAAGVAVVSGLALGIDGAAHRGVLDALAHDPEAAHPIGVVGSGHDVVYPARHRDLWAAVAAEGVLLSEAPLGARPEGWRFPARNRILAALAHVVVVVESHAGGGSLHTVDEAIRRSRPVLAAPGSVRNPAAAGTNQLLADGCHPVRDVDDVLVALGLATASGSPRRDERAAPDATGAVVLDAFAWEPCTLEVLAMRTGLALPVLALAVEALVGAGWVAVEGGWYERVAGG